MPITCQHDDARGNDDECPACKRRRIDRALECLNTDLLRQEHEYAINDFDPYGYQRY